METLSSPDLATITRKIVVAMLIFGVTFALVSHLRPLLISNRPLPGGGGPYGRCAMWFVGSSTIARWKTMTQVMAPWEAENRGIEGALIGEITTRFEASKSKEAPGTLVLLAGDNDLAAGADASEVATRITQFLGNVRRRMPHTRIIVLSVKPSPTRWSLRPEQLRVDALLRSSIAGQPRISFADAESSLLVEGQPGPYYVDDGIHLNESGYRVWGDAVRRAVERSASPAAASRCARQAATA